MNYRLLTDGEKDVEETPNVSNPDHQDLASLARWDLSFDLQHMKQYMTKDFVTRGFKKFLPSAEPIEGNDSSLVTFRLLLEIAQLSKKKLVFSGAQ